MIKLELSIEEATIIKALLEHEKDRIHLQCTGNQPMLERNFPYLELLEDLRFDLAVKIELANLTDVVDKAAQE